MNKLIIFAILVSLIRIFYIKILEHFIHLRTKRGRYFTYGLFIFLFIFFRFICRMTLIKTILLSIGLVLIRECYKLISIKMFKKNNPEYYIGINPIYNTFIFFISVYVLAYIYFPY
jgi:hypothetical protein